MRQNRPNQLTLHEGDVRARLRSEDPRLHGYGLELAVQATLDRQAQHERDRKNHRDDPRQVALAL